GGGVTLVPESAVDPDAIVLGSGTDAAANTLELSDAELDFITTSTLRIGDSSALALTITGPIDLTVTQTVTTLDLRSSADIVDSNVGDDLTVTNLRLTGASIGLVDGLEVSVDSLFTSTAGGNQFIAEADGLTALDLSAGAGNIALALSEGAVSDTDASTDIAANAAVITLLDLDDSGDSFGTLANPIATSTNSLEIVTDNGTNNGDQFIDHLGNVNTTLLAGKGTIQLVATGTITLDDNSISGGTISLEGIAVNATGLFGDATPAVTTSTGTVSLTASNGVSGIDVSGVTNLTIDVGFDFSVHSSSGSTLTDLTVSVNGDAISDAYVLSGFSGFTLGLSDTNLDADGVNDLLIAGMSSLTPMNVSFTTRRGNIYLNDPGLGSNAINLPGGNITLTASDVLNSATEGSIFDRDPNADGPASSSLFNLITDSASTVTF
ncbi:MAG: hypothetical protein ACRD2A_17100, partial [Vicinamibacterales bacterium]